MRRQQLGHRSFGRRLLQMADFEAKQLDLRKPAERFAEAAHTVAAGRRRGWTFEADDAALARHALEQGRRYPPSDGLVVGAAKGQSLAAHTLHYHRHRHTPPR